MATSPLCSRSARMSHRCSEGDPTPLGETTECQDDAAYSLTTVISATGATDASYTYDPFARVRTYTDSEGWTATYDYDVADRVTKGTYPDASGHRMAAESSMTQREIFNSSLSERDGGISNRHSQST
jgi:YD repeat-containing protein